MTIEKILFIDDELQNGITATSVDSRIEYFGNFSEVSNKLGNYDLIITDLKMGDVSGFDVVEAAVKQGIIPYIATGGTYEHGGHFDKVSVFNHATTKIFYKMTKKDECFWREAIEFIKNHEEDKLTKQVKNALERCFKTIGQITPSSVEMVMDMYRKNYDFLTGGRK